MNGVIATAKRQWTDLPLGDAFVKGYEYCFSRLPESCVIVELGSLLGKTTCALAATLASQPNRHVNLNTVEDWKRYDLEAGNDLESLCWRVADLPRVFQEHIRECGAEPYLSLWEADIIEAASYFDDGEVDFLAVNYHSWTIERQKVADVWEPKLKAGGMALLQNYPNRGDFGQYSLSVKKIP